MSLSQAPTREPMHLPNGQINPKWLIWINQVQKTVNSVDYTGKADKVGGAPNGLLARLNAAGNLVAVTDLTQYVGSLDIQVNDDGDGTITLQWLRQPLRSLAAVMINGQTLTKQTIYTVPAGKTLVPHGVILRSPSASLAGLTDMDIGGNAAADDWLQQISLNAFTATTDYGLVVQPEQAAGPPIVPVKKTLYAAGTVFGIKINTGSTGAANFIAELIGYLF